MADKKVKKKRNLLVEHPAMTHQEIADYFGTSRAAVSQLEISGLRKLKKALEEKGYTMEDFLGDDWDK
jgi:DNA-directed RNA polymerase sigma subunit (sigma70/sigma32)